MYITKNFTKQELSCRCGCGEMGYTQEFLDLLQKLRDKFGKPMVITSGARCYQHNLNVGGARFSKHLSSAGTTPCAVDVACTNGHDRAKLFFLAGALGFKGFGIAKTFIHLDTRDGESIVFSY